MSIHAQGVTLHVDARRPERQKIPATPEGPAGGDDEVVDMALLRRGRYRRAVRSSRPRRSTHRHRHMLERVPQRSLRPGNTAAIGRILPWSYARASASLVPADTSGTAGLGGLLDL